MSIYILEAIISLKENIRYALTFILFLSLSFLGVIITDSLIYSVSMQAEKELKSRGDNIISIELYQHEKKDNIDKVLNKYYTKLSYSQRSFLTGGNSPYSDEAISVIAIDKAGINLLMGGEFDDSLFEGNVAVYNNNNLDISNKPQEIFFNGVPFQIIGVKNKSKAEFLDSLGLSPGNSNEKYYIPLDTLFRFNLDNEIDNIQIIFDKDVTTEMSTSIKNQLKKNNIDKYMITTSLDARAIVERVLNRFSLLTNSIYLLLTITAIISCIVVCKRNFQSRSTEFALKIIHGISYKEIQIVVVIETIFTVIVSLLLSIAISILSIMLLSSILNISVKIRWLMILMSLSAVLILCFIANLLYGNKTFKINPIELIKARTK
ncbi:FtsX-like permease family protein [Citrobacter rodentium]|nr:FtsX-like permease family protein [Citrobacter rodentium]KIQ50636.1 permease [Citrobacter rodentium]QBY31577.1 ABC transporter permease [Citrobacter rodentium]UHO31064.1 ABC transporter permease [Citrobacter rodentium NBRC 105723 = DSM 16636]HAT8013570.1 ABC transporter permease [Citrobacter rodentium NBRC 105723 = DSM 16636]HAT8018139.1 ABC transporter permease [Citrobacter rodentium]